MSLRVLIACALSFAAAALAWRAPAHGAPKSAAAQPRPGAAFEQLTAAERARFELGRAAFERAFSIEAGLGPLFNDTSCARCHNKRGVGGAGIQVAFLAGRLQKERFDPLLSAGGPLLAAHTVMEEPRAAVQRWIPRCALSRDGEPVPREANVVTRRRTTPLFGLGLVDATPAASFIELARRQPAAIRGRAAMVHDVSAGKPALGKFGWKAQAPSLHQFAGLALNHELGVTNPDFPEEHAPSGAASLLADCDAVSQLEGDAALVASLADFMRLLAPISALSEDAEARAGSVLFGRVGCDGCHVRELRSGPHPIAALSQRRYAPYSDFLLHDMGELGDGIAEGDAAPRELRTAPLWGLRLSGSARLLHDGRARSFEHAIAQHDGQGRAARAAFLALSPVERQQLVRFLETL